MILLANLMNGVASVFQVILSLIEIILILSAVFSWFPTSQYHPAVRGINAFTNIILRPIRKFIPVCNYIDWSMLVAFIIVVFLQVFLVTSLFDYAAVLKRM